MKRVVVFLAAAIAIPLAIGDGSDCPGLAVGELTGHCTITQGLELAGSLVVPKDINLALDGAVLRFTDPETPSELLVAGTLHVRDSMIEAAEGVDLTIRFEPESNGKLEDSSMMGSLDVDEAARLESYWSVRVVADLAVEGPAELTVRDVHDEVRATSSLEHEEILLLLVQVQEGKAIERLDPYRFILKSGSAADHAELEIDAKQDVVLVLNDDDQDAPEWTTQPGQHDSIRPGYSHNGTVAMEWDADDTMGGDFLNRAVSHYRILLDGEELVERVRGTRATIEDLPEGHHAFTVEAIDLVGNVATSNPLAIHVDKTPPTIEFDAQATDGGIEVTVTATEPGDHPSGLAFLRWRIGDGPTTIVAGDGALELEAVVSLGPGNHSLFVITEDLAGHRVEAVQEIILDTSAPTFLARLEPRLPTGAWHREAPLLLVDVLDYGPSGEGSVEYRVGDGDWQEYGNSTVLDAVGEHRVQVRVVDAAGNEAITQLRAALDPDAPSIDVEVIGLEGRNDWFLGPVQITASATDSASGLERLEYRVAQGAWRPFDGLLLESSGEHRIALRATDAAGNQALHESMVLLDAEPPTPPIVSWMTREGRVQGDWSRAPPADGVSGIAEIIVERHGTNSTMDADAKGYSMALPNGEHRLRVRVVDVAGNAAATSWTMVTVENSTVTADGGTKVRGEVILAPGAVDDIVEARFFVDGVLLDATATQPYTTKWQTRNLNDGLHEVRVVAVDLDGLHHEDLRTYNVRNGYTAVLVDEALPVGLALVASTGALAVASVGFVRWRRWTL